MEIRIPRALSAQVKAQACINLARTWIAPQTLFSHDSWWLVQSANVYINLYMKASLSKFVRNYRVAHEDHCHRQKLYRTRP